MASHVIYLKQPNCIYISVCLWLAYLVVVNAEGMLQHIETLNKETVRAPREIGRPRGTIGVDENHVFISSGENVHLPCNNALPDCTSTTWIYNRLRNSAAIELIAGGIKNKDKERNERLSLGSNCSLNIKNVAKEDYGIYTCRQYMNGKQRGTDARVFLHILHVSSLSSSSQTDISANHSVTLSCQLYSYAGASCVDLIRSQGIELFWVNQAGVKLTISDSRYQILFSSGHCISTLNTTLLNEDENRGWRCEFTHRDQVKSSPNNTVKSSSQANSTLAVIPVHITKSNTKTAVTSTQAMASQPMEVAALGRPLSLGMLYDCRKDSFIPGVTLWDKKSLSENLDIHPQPLTDVKFSGSDSLSSKSNLLDVSASLKASFMTGLVDVDGSAKYLRNTKSSNQQSRVVMYFKETTKFKQLTMSQLGHFSYPQVFDQKTATHVVTAVLYGAQAFMVFDRMILEHENKQEIEGELKVMVRKIPEFSIDGKGSVNMTEDEKEKGNKIACSFHGDFLLDRNPTTYTEAIQTYNKLPTLLKENPDNVVPIKVWLHPLYLLDNKAAQLEREISTSLLSNIEEIIEVLGEAERTCNDLLKRTLVNVFSDIKERLLIFHRLFRIYKTMFLEAVRRVLPAVRAGEMEMSLEDILNIHMISPFNADIVNQWLDDAKSELHILSSYIKKLQRIKIENSVNLITTLFDPDIDAVVCLTFTSLKYEDPYLSALNEFMKFDNFTEPDRSRSLSSVKAVRKWFNDPEARKRMRQNLSHFRRFSEANKDEKRIRFIISAISNTSITGSSIYLFEKGELIDTQFQPVSKPPPPIVKKVWDQSVSLKLHMSSSNNRVQYRLEYKKAKNNSGAEEKWLFTDTFLEDFTLTGLESGTHYLIRGRRVDNVGVSEASNAVSTATLESVIVGGTGGDAFSFVSTYDEPRNTIKEIIITYMQTNSRALNTIQVIFQDCQMIKVGKVEGKKEVRFNFDENDKIVTATLWPNKDHTRFGGLEFLVENNIGERITMSIKCAELGEPVIINVGSGKCHGIKGRSGDEIDALGFYFI